MEISLVCHGKAVFEKLIKANPKCALQYISYRQHNQRLYNSKKVYGSDISVDQYAIISYVSHIGFETPKLGIGVRSVDLPQYKKYLYPRHDYNKKIRIIIVDTDEDMDTDEDVI
jgi:hypothetical protein